MIPDRIFDPILRSLSLAVPSTARNFASIEVIPRSWATDYENSFPEEPIRLWYRTDCEPTYEHFARRLREELRRLRHESTSTIAGALLALYALRPDRKESPTAVMNELLSSVVDSNLSQFFVFPHIPPPECQRYRIGEFSIGQLVVRNLSSRSRKAGSDYFERYKPYLVGRFAVERDTVPVRVVDLSNLRPKYGLEAAGQRKVEWWNRSVEAYFGGVASVQFDTFWDRFGEAQQLLTAFGAPYLDERRLRQTPSAKSISIFSEINDSWGHVAPTSQSGFHFNFGSEDKRIPDAGRSLLVDFGVDVNADLAPPLKSYSLFTAKAIRYANDGRADESLLHFVIALELLFGERQKIAQSISRRVAVLIFRPFGVSLVQAEKTVDRIYDARSGYVHAGKSVSAESLADARSVCEEILRALMRRIRACSSSQDADESWMTKLDYVYSAFAAGVVVPDAELELCGIGI